MARRVLDIDLETFSELDLKTVGTYKYAENCQIILCAYSFDDDPVQIIEGDLPDKFIAALFDPDIIKFAFNAVFEIQVLSHYLRKPLDVSQWRCTMVTALQLGLPASLERLGEVLHIDQKKLSSGKKLIKLFSQPHQNGLFGNRVTPAESPDKWEEFKDYCKRDVESERSIRQYLNNYFDACRDNPLWQLDFKINSNGVLIDSDFVRGALDINQIIRRRALDEAFTLTGGINLNSNTQLAAWIEHSEGIQLKTLDKSARADLQTKDLSADVRRVLELKDIVSKSSIKKYEAMPDTVCEDGRVHGMFQFYGANRTGRWTSKLIQLQNLPQNHIDDLDSARLFVINRNIDGLDLFYDSPADILSQLIRTAFIAPEGSRFIVADFSAIEARIIAWLADEQWRMDVFADGGDIYCASASAMFGVPVEKHGVNKHLRQKGKIAELACIAEGELVLTDKGLVPIENVTLEHKLWDGEEWVSHDGVIFKGKRKVIDYDGLSATPDHLVWIEEIDSPVLFAFAAVFKCRLKRIGNDQTYRKTVWNYKNKVNVYDIRNAGKHHRFTVSGRLVHNCGYGGGVGALKAFGADKLGLSSDDMQNIIDKWRKASPNIVNLWQKAESCAKKAVADSCTVNFVKGIKFGRVDDFLFILLPSGRKISYFKPALNDKNALTYEGNQVTSGAWGHVSTWGGKLIENVVQAIARDCLAVAMYRIDRAGYKIVMHVHDEIICEMPDGSGSLEEIIQIMCKPLSWASGLNLNADGYETKFYKKD